MCLILFCQNTILKSHWNAKSHSFCQTCKLIPFDRTRKIGKKKSGMVGEHNGQDIRASKSIGLTIQL